MSKYKRLMKGVSFTASNQHETCLVCHLPYNNISPEQLYSSKDLVKTFRCVMVTRRFEMKILYLAIRIHKSSILSVTTFDLLPRITNSFENIISVQCVKLV